MDRLKILSANILHMDRSGRYPSDHYPVTTTVEWAEAKNVGRKYGTTGPRLR